MISQTKKNRKEDRMTHEQQMRARIKDAAFKLMAEQGIESMSMRQIAEKVHVTKPVLYYYFKDKEDLCVSIIEERVRQFNSFLDSALAKGPDITELLSLIFERHLEFFQDDPRNSKFIARTISYALSNKATGFIKDGSEKMDRLHDVFERAVKKGEIPEKGLADFERLVRAVVLQIMLSAYVQMHVPYAAPAGREHFYDKATVKRLAQVIVSGIKEYYKGNQK